MSTITRSLSSLLTFALLALPLVACDADEPDDAEVDRAGELSTNKIATADYFRVTSPDYRKCAAPACGGWFVARVNTEVTRCADGTWQQQCHMFDVDLDKLELDEASEAKAREAIGAGLALVRGELASVDVGAAWPADVLIASEVWIGVTGSEPLGHVSRVDDTALVCVTYPCASFVERSLNTTMIGDLDHVDLSTSGATLEQQSAGMTELGASGLLVVGEHVIVEGPGGSMNALEASEFYSRL